MRTYRILAVLGWLLPSLASSCPVLSEQEQIEQSAKSRIEVSNAVADLYLKADSVFVGRLVEIDWEEVPKTNQDRLGEIRRYWVSFEILRQIKGTQRATRFQYEKDSGLIHVGCSDLVGFNDVDLEVMKGYRFLVYAKDGVILRENQIIDWFDQLSTEEELKMLEEHGIETKE